MTPPGRRCQRTGSFTLGILLLMGSVQMGSAYKNNLFQGQNIIDLTRPLDEHTIVWPGGQPFEFTKKVAEFKLPKYYWYAANDLRTAEHCGTHIDAPYHFNKLGWKVADIPIGRLLTVGVFVNASSEADGNPQYKLPISKLTDWEERNGPFPSNSFLLVSFGWSSRYKNKDAYLGPNGTLSFPGLSKEAAEWIAGTKKIVGVGVDTASVDQGGNVDAHIALQGNNLYHVENVAIDEPLPPLFNVILMPMKLTNGTGAPCRVIAIL